MREVRTYQAKIIHKADIKANSLKEAEDIAKMLCQKLIGEGTIKQEDISQDIIVAEIKENRKPGGNVVNFPEK